MKKALCNIVGFCAITMASTASENAGANANLEFSWASVDQGRSILTNRDEFLDGLSQFDRAARMKSPREITEEDYLHFLSASVEAWQPEESNKLAGVLTEVRQKLAPWDLPFPTPVYLIKTSGREEGRASYTRQNAIILPENELLASQRQLRDLVIHELFHVLSRQNPGLRTNLYRVIGFTGIGPVEYPQELRPRKITNPDGVNNGWMIQVNQNGVDLPVVPLLYASDPKYDPAKGGEFFNYLVFKFLVVETAGNRWQPKLIDGRPQLLDPNEVQGFFEKIGRNTDYIIHPDEILACNFVPLINGSTNVPSPAILSEMRKVLSR